MKDEKNPVFPFVFQSEANAVLPILKSRLPGSAHVHNMAMNFSKFRESIKIYTLCINGMIPGNAWVIVIGQREDYGTDINISAPVNPEITDEIKDAFSNSSLINWNKAYIFAAVERPISLMLLELSVVNKAKATTVSPCYLFYKDMEESKALEPRCADEGMTLKPLDINQGLEFILNTWKYAREGSDMYMKKVIERNPSSGIYLTDSSSSTNDYVCGAITTLNGLMGSLYTTKDHRQKGLGKQCFQYLMKQLAIQDYVPCSTVEIGNVASIHFHEKVGMQKSHICDFVFHTASEW